MNIRSINNFIKACDVESEWKNSIPYKIISLSSDLTAKNLSGKDKSKANTKRGVYRWSILDKVIYIGRATSSTIGQRQSSHLTSYRKIYSNHERTGKKLRKYMKDNLIDTLIIQIEYIDMSDIQESIEWFEKKCIATWQPILNSQMK